MSENFEKCIICHEDATSDKLNKCTTCSAHYCACCLISLMMNSFKKDSSILNCCYCSKKMQIKFNNGIELPIDICSVENIELPFFGLVEFNDKSDWCTFNEDLKYINSLIFGDNYHDFHFNDATIRKHVYDRSQWYECHITCYEIKKFRLNMFPKNQIYYYDIDENLETQTTIHVHNQLHFDYNPEQNRWDFVREHSFISKRKSCMQCQGAVSRNHQFHVSNSKVHKKFLEDREKAVQDSTSIHNQSPIDNTVD